MIDLKTSPRKRYGSVDAQILLRMDRVDNGGREPSSARGKTKCVCWRASLEVPLNLAGRIVSSAKEPWLTYVLPGNIDIRQTPWRRNHPGYRGDAHAFRERKIGNSSRARLHAKNLRPFGRAASEKKCSPQCTQE